MSDKDPVIVSFHGADGCGKSTLANAFAGELEQTCGAPSVIIGGSSYMGWLTPDIANQTIGGDHHFGEVARTSTEKTRLYEEIAVVCYAYAGHLHDDLGLSVVIDSDPVLKRLLWNRLSSSGDELIMYESEFGNYISEKVSESAFPTAIVGVNLSGEVDTVDIQARILRRGGNSEYDPSSLTETERICGEATKIWEELRLAALGLSGLRLFNTRFSGAYLLGVTNTDCAPEKLDTVMKKLSRQIIDTVL